jgi:hypothetical protein
VLFALSLCTAGAQIRWLPHEAGVKLPDDAVFAAQDGHAKLYVCRAQLKDGVHPGATAGGACLIPNRGNVEKAGDYEIAAGSGYSWSAPGWENAVPAGLQHKVTDLYSCRAEVASTDGGKVMAVGKAYRRGPHTGHCYVACQDHEVDVTSGFEVLRSSAGASSR